MMSQDEDTGAQKPTLGREPVRLRSEPHSESNLQPATGWALSLLGEARPYQVQPGRQERVWRELQTTRPRQAVRLRWAFAGASILVCALFASAALAQWPAWLARSIGSTPTLDTSRTETPAAVPDRRAHRWPVERPTQAEAPPPAADVSPPPSVPSGQTFPSVRPRHAARPTAPEDTGPLLEAMRALRVEQNPMRARALLSSYLERHPRGKLSEEALAMLVEAAVAHHDSDASALAARFYKLYPRSPFRGQIKRILSTGAARSQ